VRWCGRSQDPPLRPRDHARILRYLNTSEPTQKAPPAATSAAAAAVVRVLLVEDNLVNQMVAKQLVQKMGHVCDIANHGKEAIDLLDSGQVYRLVLMDLQMPVMDGFEAMTEIRSRADTRALPIIVMTACVTPADRERAVAAGADAIVIKPINAAEFAKTVQSVLTRAEA
jgi:CheY-like chemotaxis protein